MGARRPHPPGCRHCRMIEEFRLARQAQDLRVEAATNGYETEKALYYKEVEPPLTLPVWLKQMAQDRDYRTGGEEMQAEIVWTQQIRHRSAIGINVDNVWAAGLDPTAPEDVLTYIRDHMDPEDLHEEIARSDDEIAREEITVEKVEEIDLRARDGAVA